MKKIQEASNSVQIKKHFMDRFTFLSSTLVVIVLMSLVLFAAFLNDWFGMSTYFMTTRIYDVYEAISYFKPLPPIMVIVPVVGGFLQLFKSRKSCHSRDWTVINMTFVTVLITFLLYPSARAGGIDLVLPNVLGLGLSMHVDMLGFIMLLLTSVMWFFVMVYAHEYMMKERHCTRFFFFMAITYSSVLGTIMAGDLLTMFLFFEIMTIASYMLVTHGQRDESYEAGYNYIFMGLIGGFAILTAMILLYASVGELSFQSAIYALNNAGNVKYFIIGLLVLGFGIKAGMAPVHVWLPRAHPVAPTPASALLSGIMIKVGAYGILRVAASYYFPAQGSVSSVDDILWITSENVGAGLIWLGIITMAIGVFMALQQSHMKRMLAYHSISQMGYILMGIGIALYLGYWGAMGYAGAVYHIINHALFKSLLFMVAGVVYYHTKENNMYKLGGLWRKLPLSATVMFIASVGIAGVPLFNGFISKTILHHGIVEAYEYGAHMFFYAEVIFLIVSAGTVASFVKLFYYVFLGKMPEKFKSIKPEYNCLDTAMAAIAILIILIGLNPQFILQSLIVPQLNITTYDPYFVSNYIVGLGFFTLHDLFTMTWIIGLGFLIFILGTRFHLFHLKLPGWLRFEFIFFYPLNWMMRLACKWMYGDQCRIDTGDLAQMAIRNNYKVGFLERFIFMTSAFNRRYENSIIKSDAFIYTTFITIILIVMWLFNTL